MRRTPWATYLWPGLPQLWYRGLGAGLALAAGCAILLNLLLLASFVWVELLSPWHLKLGWLAIGTLWCGAAVLSARNSRREVTEEAVSTEGLFREALSEYLQRSWFEAERILVRLLHLYPRDVEEVLYESPKVAEAVVVGVQPPKWPFQRVKAYVVLREGASVSEEELMALCKRRLEEYAVPWKIEFVKELPKNFVGKVLRRLLVESQSE